MGSARTASPRELTVPAYRALDERSWTWRLRCDQTRFSLQGVGMPWHPGYTIALAMAPLCVFCGYFSLFLLGGPNATLGVLLVLWRAFPVVLFFSLTTYVAEWFAWGHGGARSPLSRNVRRSVRIEVEAPHPPRGYRRGRPELVWFLDGINIGTPAIVAWEDQNGPGGDKSGIGMFWLVPSQSVNARHGHIVYWLHLSDDEEARDLIHELREWLECLGHHDPFTYRLDEPTKLWRDSWFGGHNRATDDESSRVESRPQFQPPSRGRLRCVAWWLPVAGLFALYPSPWVLAAAVVLLLVLAWRTWRKARVAVAERFECVIDDLLGHDRTVVPARDV